MKVFVLILLLGKVVLAVDNPQYQQLSQCIEALNGGWAGGNYSTTVLSDLSAQGSSLMVVNEKGAKVVKASEKNDLDSSFGFNFVPVGEQKAYNENFYIGKDSISKRWSDSAHVMGGEKQARAVGYEEAIQFAGKSLFKYVNQNASQTESNLKVLEGIMRGQTAASESNMRGQVMRIDINKLMATQLQIQISLKNLEKCQSVPNQDIKFAAKIEKDRLDVITSRLSSLEKEYNSQFDCKKENTSSAPSSTSSGIR